MKTHNGKFRVKNLIIKKRKNYLPLLDPVLLLTAKREQAWNSHYGTYVRGDESSLLELDLKLRREIYRCKDFKAIRNQVVKRRVHVLFSLKF